MNKRTRPSPDHETEVFLFRYPDKFADDYPMKEKEASLRTAISAICGIIYDACLMQWHHYWAMSFVNEYHDLQSQMGYPKGYPIKGMKDLEQKYNPNLRMYRLKSIYHFRKSNSHYERSQQRAEIFAG